MEKLRGLGHLFATVFMWAFGGFIVVPAVTDVTMSALCPGTDECSLAIYLSGFQQAIIGLGTVMLTPLIGNLSDEYGRKALLTLPMVASIIPLAIMAYSRETKFFYTYFILRTLTAMVGESVVVCLALAYVADNVPITQRASAFGVLSGLISAAVVCSTLAARFIPSIALIFQIGAGVSMVAVVYMRIFLPESIPDPEANNASVQPLLKGNQNDDIDGDNTEPVKQAHVFKRIPSVKDAISLMRTSLTFSQAAVVAFFNSLAEGATQASLLYFLKARFHFNKTQFADLMLIVGIAGTFSQLLVMPLLVPLLGEERLLSIGLLLGFTHMLLYSMAWAVWVPYAAAGFSIFVFFASPCVRSIASKQVGPIEQGKAQGCISGIASFANIVSPLIFSPLTALFLSERAPFHYPGFSILCIGVAMMLGFIQSLMIRPAPPSISKEYPENTCSTEA
ncbi:hippocampus abundant transcript-like protein 1 [Punica granatum]|uniref:Hippocampus abundant transcript-like protein 1 n=2 Tax=Punica granatum TaxID=22663 RepID=A0A6P8CF94_PUNGR|nr:hippocampus abundant transcript-like protein 1 [Punica granatum]PKI59824.1 hypothetical protein CRG98_019772 [Punica granatum]